MAYRKVGGQEKAVRAALTAKPPAPEDMATAELALGIAKTIDEDGMDFRLAAALLAALEALQMSPRSRKVVKTDDKPSVNPLDDLAARRRSRTG